MERQPCPAKKRPVRTAGGVLVASLVVISSGTLSAVEWDDGAGATTKLWDDNANWRPDGDPDGEPVEVGSLDAAIGDQTLVDRFYSIDSLTVSNGAGVANSTNEGATNSYELLVNGLTRVGGTGSSLTLFGGTTDGLDTDFLQIDSGASVVLVTTAKGPGIVEVDGDATLGVLDINSGGTLGGAGRVDLELATKAPTNVMVNDGIVRAFTNPVFPGAVPEAGSLRITAPSADARFDWDGGSGNGALHVNGNQTLDIDVNPGNDFFGGSMNLATGATIDIAHPWTLDAGTIRSNTPAFGIVLPGRDPSAGQPATIDGAEWEMTGGRITIDDRWDSLQINSQLMATGGTIENWGTLIFNDDATIGNGADLRMFGLEPNLTVGSGSVVTIASRQFDLDGLDNALGETTIGAGAALNIRSSSADVVFGHTIHLEGGEFDVANPSSSSIWFLDSGGTINVRGGATSHVDGDPWRIAGSINVEAGAGLSVTTEEVSLTGASVDVAAGGEFKLGSTAWFPSADISVKGEGTFSFGPRPFIGADMGGSAFPADVTVDVAHVVLGDAEEDFIIVDDSSLTINADTLDMATGGLEGNIRILEGGSLTVNLIDGAPFVWKSGTLNHHGTGSNHVFLGASESPLEFHGVMHLYGRGEIAAPLRLVNAEIELSDPEDVIRLSGAPSGDLVHTMSNSMIAGRGRLELADATLQGTGSINVAVVTADGSSNSTLVAEGGTLSFSGSTIELDELVVRGDDAELAVLSDCYSEDTRIVLEGGTITDPDGGSVLVNAGIITGDGTITAKIDNKNVISVTGSRTLTLVSPIGSLLDGELDSGVLRVSSGGTLELQHNRRAIDVPFHGTIELWSGNLVSTGTHLDLLAESTLTMSRSTLQSNMRLDLRGSLSVGGSSPSRIKTSPVFFHSGAGTTLSSELVIDGGAIIYDGASFSGAGQLTNGPESTMSLRHEAVVDVLLDNDGMLKVGRAPSAQGSRVAVKDLQLNGSGSLEVDINGPGLLDYDRLSVSGVAQLGGTLRPIVTNGFVPSPGETYVILTAPAVIGAFEEVIQPALPGTLAFEVVYQPSSVQLRVTGSDAYGEWISSFPSLTDPGDRARSADPDGDGRSNLAEFGVDGDPTSAANDGKIVGQIVGLTGVDAYTLSLPVRLGAVPAADDPPGGALALEQTGEGVRYAIQAGDTLPGLNLTVSEVTGVDATAAQAGLPALNAGWEYRSFRGPGSVADRRQLFMSLVVSQPEP